MQKALIFSGAVSMSCAILIFFVQGRQARRELDEQKNQGQGMMRIGELTNTSSNPLLVDSAKSLQKLRAPTSTDSFHTLNSFHARNLVAGGGIAI
jgi:hypothetical protein